MPTFIYKAVDQKGKNHKGSIDSDTEKSAIFALKAQGLIPLSISLTSKKFLKIKNSPIRGLLLLMKIPDPKISLKNYKAYISVRKTFPPPISRQSSDSWQPS